MKPLLKNLPWLFVLIPFIWLPAAQAEQRIISVSEKMASSDLKAAKPVTRHNKKTLSQFASKTRDEVTSQSIYNDFWVYDSWITLLDDIDGDAYYSRFLVEFDVDTIYVEAPVYAVVYLGDADEYEAIHVSDTFWVHGETTTDSYIVDSELVSGFSAYDYDILIEIYDADTDELVAFSDGYEDADLAFVSLESQNYDIYRETVVVTSHVHGGSVMIASLAFLAAIICWRKIKKS
ncbi:choice-of-anchor H family protein [Alteromonas sp. ASW11-130]|uniref:choice-of-anchor H family protein n=1 Tax=Alteromonas sp. ASW11-130 TaxID=3015775 RepID=UPI00224221B0|nr:choice-of-anchor H family protein [Alteromonas sp. ASW11-130]MCW8091733.1 choice-of-anchor H family protein [Alteromonas sp. ASW11-130]